MNSLHFEQVPYNGMIWRRPDPDIAHAVARSAKTTLSYLLDFTSPEKVYAYVFLCGDDTPDPSNASHLRQQLGTYFINTSLAALVAERHDWSFQTEQAAADEKELIFIGSSKIRPLAEVLRQKGEQDGDPDALFDLLSDDYVCPDGRNFRRVASYFQAKKSGLKQNSNGSYTISFIAEAADIPRWLSEAPLSSPCVLGAAEVTIPSGPEQEWNERASQAFRRAHAMPDDPAFQEWLGQHYDRHGLIATARTSDSDAVAKAVLETLKRICGFATRRQLMTDRDAVEKVEKIDREFYLDMSRAANF